MKKHLSWIILAVLFAAVTFWAGAQVYFGQRQELSLEPARGQAGHEPAAPEPARHYKREYRPLRSTVPYEPTENRQRHAKDSLGYVSKYGDLPESLRGSDVWGGLRTDEKGDLVIDRDVRDVFDFFMSGLGEESREVVLGRVREYIGCKLDANAASQANRILDDYLAYKDYLAHTHNFDRLRDPNLVRNRQAMAAAIQEMFQVQIEERRRFLGKKVADAFFASDEANDRASISAFEGSEVHE